MCGIFALLNQDLDENIVTIFNNGVKRGPENSIISQINNLILGFHRLAINGIDSKSNQPFDINNIKLICNGEIYNFRELAKDNDITMTTNSDCEIIIHLYKKFGIEYTLNLLDGVFAFILYDIKLDQIFIARDPYGVRPLFYFEENNTIGFASEIKSLYNLCINKNNIFEFPVGSYNYIKNNKLSQFSKYTCLPFRNEIYNTLLDNKLFTEIYNKLNIAVKKRVVGTTERPIGCLLSGGLDSSLIACLVNKELQLNNYKNQEKKILNTFSIGLPGSEDLKYARIVSKHINSNHHEIIVSEDDFFNAIPEVIATIESYDTTTVRASVGNYLVSKYIKENTDCKVIFNGDGADELMGGYLYFKKAPNSYEFDKECRRLLQDISKFDVLRSDRSISSNGLEARTPFLDRGWVEFYLSISREERYATTVNNCEKYLLRNAVEINNPELLPKEILWRKKEAFSDGVSGLDRSWYTIINEKIQILCEADKELDLILHEILNNNSNIFLYNPPTTLEQSYYRYLYTKYYCGTEAIIPYFWMPKFVEAKDAIARTLNIYKED